jgi:hypothetical protein
MKPISSALAAGKLISKRKTMPLFGGNTKHVVMASVVMAGRAWKPLGRLTLVEMPRIGEWIIVYKDGSSFTYEVLMVAHSAEGNGTDIHLKELGPSVAVGKRLEGLL